MDSAEEGSDVANTAVWTVNDGDDDEAERIIELEDNVEEEGDTTVVDGLELELDKADVDADEVLDSTFELGTSTAR